MKTSNAPGVHRDGGWRVSSLVLLSLSLLLTNCAEEPTDNKLSHSPNPVASASPLRIRELVARDQNFFSDPRVKEFIQPAIAERKPRNTKEAEAFMRSYASIIPSQKSKEFNMSFPVVEQYDEWADSLLLYGPANNLTYPPYPAAGQVSVGSTLTGSNELLLRKCFALLIFGTENFQSDQFAIWGTGSGLRTDKAWEGGVPLLQVALFAQEDRVAMEAATMCTTLAKETLPFVLRIRDEFKQFRKAAVEVYRITARNRLPLAGS